MREITATEIARRFSEVLDEVEHRSEAYRIVRRGRPVAELRPAATANGAAFLELVTRFPPDDAWLDDLHALRSLLYVEERDWSD